MAGFDAPYVPGWDCHGLPIEIKVDQELGQTQSFDDGGRKSAANAGHTPLNLSTFTARNSNAWAFWAVGSDPYLTMSAEYEAVIAQTFVDFLDKGYVYKGLKPVHWCIKDRTALAEAEVEYENHPAPLFTYASNWLAILRRLIRLWPGARFSV